MYIIFYLERTEKNPGFTSNVEIGMWLKSNNIFVCIPDDSRKKNANAYIRIKCDQAGIPVFNTLEETIIAVDEKLNNKDNPKKWFLSDTHFRGSGICLLYITDVRIFGHHLGHLYLVTVIAAILTHMKVNALLLFFS